MIQDQNTITLMTQNGYHEEYLLDPSDAGLVLPGSIVSFKSPNVATSQAVDLAAVEPLIVKENALLGGSINRPSMRGNVILLHRGVSGDRYLLRAVAGTYRISEPLYLVQTANGIYLTNVANNAQRPFAYSLEDFTISAAIVDLKDESSTDGFGKNEVPNGGLVNLLQVRLA